MLVNYVYVLVHFHNLHEFVQAHIREQVNVHVPIKFIFIIMYSYMQMFMFK